MDLQSLMGYAYNSPFNNAPYLDIKTPEGLIDMANTPIDLMGIDNLGNVKKMKAGRKNPYKFAGTTVREIPVQQGGWIPNAGNPGMIGDMTYLDALQNAEKLKIRKSGDFKALIPMEWWNDDMMNYIDKFKIVKRKGEQYIKARGELPKGMHQMPDGSLMPDEEMLQLGGMPAYDPQIGVPRSRWARGRTKKFIREDLPAPDPSTSTVKYTASDDANTSRSMRQDAEKARAYQAEKERIDRERVNAETARSEDGYFQFPDGTTKKFDDMNLREKFYVSGRNLGSLQRGDMTDLINPAAWIGSMAEGLGISAYEAQRTNSIMPYVTGIGTPLVAGALAGMAPNVTTSQFVNNLVNPIAGTIGTPAELKQVVGAIGRKFTKGNPYTLSATEKDVLQSVRNIGHIANSGDVNTLPILEGLQKKAANLTDEQFEKIVGFKKSELEPKIESLRDRQNKKVDTDRGSDFDLGNEAERRMDALNEEFIDRHAAGLSDDISERINRESERQRLREQFTQLDNEGSPFTRSNEVRYDAEGNPIGNLIDNRSPSGSFRIPLSEDAEISALVNNLNLPPSEFGNRLNRLMESGAMSRRDFEGLSRANLLTNEGGSQEEIRNIIHQFQHGYPLQNPPSSIYLRDALSEGINQQRGPSLLAKLRRKIANEMSPSQMPITESLIPSLSKTAGNNPAKEILSAYNKVKGSEKGTSFIPAHSLSSDSYPISLSMINRAVGDDIVDVGFHGYSSMNSLGFSDKAGINKAINIKEMNSMIDDINSKLDKKIPYVRQNLQGNIEYPNLTVTKKKLGGNPYRMGGSLMPDEEMLQGGGSMPPIYTSNPNDPRLRAYQDSLAVYNSYLNAKKEIDREGYKLIKDKANTDVTGELDVHMPYFEGYEDYYRERAKKDKSNNFTKVDDRRYVVKDVDDAMVNKNFSGQLFDTEIAPMGETMYRDKRSFVPGFTPDNYYYTGNNKYWIGMRNDVRTIFNYRNAKPVQPVIYQKQQDKYGPKQAYNDSLTLYNTTKGDINRIKTMTPEKWWEYTAGWNDTHPEAIAAYKRLSEYNKTSPKPISRYTPQNREEDEAVEYKKPVGTPKPKRRTSSAQLIPDEMDEMNLQMQGRTNPDVDVNKVITTPFYRTYRREDGSQGTQYYPTYESFLEDTKDRPYINQQVAGDKSSARMTGYKKGGNPYQQGGSITGKQAFDFLFAEDEQEEEMKKQQPATAPSVEEVEQEQVQQVDNSDYDASMNIASQPFGNPYAGRRRAQVMGNPYTGQVRSSGMFGNQNVGEFGRQIYGELAYHLGYAPEANSIYRSQAQQNELIAKGVGVQNSYHLTGDAIDLKPADWHRLTNEQQQYYRMRYDVVVHNNHYHIEPKK